MTIQLNSLSGESFNVNDGEMMVNGNKVAIEKQLPYEIINPSLSSVDGVQYVQAKDRAITNIDINAELSPNKIWIDMPVPETNSDGKVLAPDFFVQINLSSNIPAPTIVLPAENKASPSPKFIYKSPDSDGINVISAAIPTTTMIYFTCT